jgi:type II secretory pathway pseudopilin PulG
MKTTKSMTLDRAGCEGLTLIEVLASVVILSLFIIVLMTSMLQFFTAMKFNEERQQAAQLAQNELALMSIQGALATIQQGIQAPTIVDGIGYTITLLQLPTPTWAPQSVYAEVKVTWKSISGGHPVTSSIDVEQVFMV